MGDRPSQANFKGWNRLRQQPPRTALESESSKERQILTRRFFLENERIVNRSTQGLTQLFRGEIFYTNPHPVFSARDHDCALVSTLRSNHTSKTFEINSHFPASILSLTTSGVNTGNAPQSNGSHCKLKSYFFQRVLAA